MQYKKIMCAIGIAALLFTGAGCSQQQSSADYIGAAAAKNVAMEAAGVSEAGVESVTTDMNSRNGTDYYQISFTAGGTRYQYDIDALTGVIIEEQAVASDTALVQNQENTSQTDGTQQGAGTSGSTDSGSSIGESMITQEEAKAKALAHAGLTVEQVTFVRSTADLENGRQVYDVEFYSKDYTEYDYEIDAYTGEVLSFDYDAENYVPNSGIAANQGTGSGNAGTGGTTSENVITADEAKDIVLAQVPGATENDIYEFETDFDDGRVEYEGTIFYNNTEYEFTVDGYSGAIRSWEVESIYR